MLNFNFLNNFSSNLGFHQSQCSSWMAFWDAVVASCHSSLPACNRSLFAREPSIDSRASSLTNTCASQSQRRLPPAPIRMPEWSSRLSGQKANSIHTATWHDWTQTPPLNIVQKAVFSLMHFPASFICLWPSCHSDFGGSRHGWGLFLEQTEFLQWHSMNAYG